MLKWITPARLLAVLAIALSGPLLPWACRSSFVAENEFGQLFWLCVALALGAVGGIWLLDTLGEKD